MRLLRHMKYEIIPLVTCSALCRLDGSTVCRPCQFWYRVEQLSPNLQWRKLNLIWPKYSWTLGHGAQSPVYLDFIFKQINAIENEWSNFKMKSNHKFMFCGMYLWCQQYPYVNVPNRLQSIVPWPAWPLCRPFSLLGNQIMNHSHGNRSPTTIVSMSHYLHTRWKNKPTNSVTIHWISFNWHFN